MRTGGGRRIARLPSCFQGPARRVRDALPDAVRARIPPKWTYRGDGVATMHYSPFLNDPNFQRVYRAVGERWAGGAVDVRWRMWLLTECARQCQGVGGAFAEFGVYRGASAFMILSRLRPTPASRFFLFDTFAGIPNLGLTVAERDAGFAGSLANTSVEDVRQLLAPWRDQVTLVAGDVAETLADVETGPLAFVHVDLNAADPTRTALSYAYDRLAPGALIVLDDYGWAGYEDQRAAIDTFFAGRPEAVLALPTGQGLVVKR